MPRPTFLKIVQNSFFLLFHSWWRHNITINSNSHRKQARPCRRSRGKASKMWFSTNVSFGPRVNYPIGFEFGFMRIGSLLGTPKGVQIYLKFFSKIFSTKLQSPITLLIMRVYSFWYQIPTRPGEECPHAKVYFFLKKRNFFKRL